MLVDYPILTLIVFLPALGALLSYVAGSARAARWIALSFSLLVLALASVLLAGFLWPDAIALPKMVTPGAHTYYAVEKSPWVPTLNVNYFLGADELSVVLVFLNALLTPLALAISWDEHSRVPEFFAMFLFMETTISGVFLSLDLFQFLVFWEVGLVPMYFLIAVWGGPRRSYAAFKFFLYTFLASLPLLVVIFAFYLYSSPHTFDMTAIISTLPIPPGPLADLAFVGLLIAFGTKLPTWPLHTWLPDAHVEAPTGGSVILAGVLLKLGGYGLIRFNVQMLPTAAGDLYWLPGLVGFVAEFSVFVGVYAAFGLLVFVPVLTVILTAAYYIWAMQRAIFGPPNPRWETMPDFRRFQVAPLAVLTVAFAVFGILPILIFNVISAWSQGILGGL